LDVWVMIRINQNDPIRTKPLEGVKEFVFGFGRKVQRGEETSECSDVGDRTSEGAEYLDDRVASAIQSPSEQKRGVSSGQETIEFVEEARRQDSSGGGSVTGAVIDPPHGVTKEHGTGILERIWQAEGTPGNQGSTCQHFRRTRLEHPVHGHHAASRSEGCAQ